MYACTRCRRAEFIAKEHARDMGTMSLTTSQVNNRVGRASEYLRPDCNFRPAFYF